jgi:uncharacterized integral membrane protein
MFHLGYPTIGVRAIKFGHVHPRKVYVTLKMMGLKGMGMGGSFSFILWRCFKEMVICRDLQFGAK